jgi:adenosine kinase
MRIAVAGSIATDHLMVFPGKFTDQLIADQLETVSLSFLVDELNIRRGGIAGNISYGLGCLGFNPILVGAVGQDFADYRAWLERHGVDTASVYVSEQNHTARFVCTTDSVHNQIGTFYAGAMAESRNIELAPIAERVGGLDLVIISATDPAAMLRHTEECREHGYRFAADVGQQVTRMDGGPLRQLVEDAAYLLTNEYERGMLVNKTGWSEADILAKVDAWVTTLGADGVKIESTDAAPVTVPAVPAKLEADPTGIGDGFRVGFFAGLAWGLPTERAMQFGCALATTVLEVHGPQEYTIEPDNLVRRLASAYGEEAAAQVAPFLEENSLGG